MKLSKKFVSDYVEVETDIKTLAEDMTGIGNEYDSCGKLLPVSNLVIGLVEECIPHPDSDHLHVCKVNIGSKILQIVCGAPNVREGLKVIVALDGAVLPKGTIKKGIIRGQESNGMLCSMEELGLEHKYLTDKDIDGIYELDQDAPIGEDPVKYLGLDDEIIDFELTANRGDLLSVLGMAYEIGALYNKRLKGIDLSFNETNDDIKSFFNLDIKTENCPLFLLKKVENVTIKESPSFIKSRLIASGIRPINNVVDISNYVMLETGQPLHFYDADRLGNEMVVRMAHENEKIKTLDNIERTLSESDIVIAKKDEVVGLAGVMGGLTTEIENDTKNIVIEAAIFNATIIRKTSKKVLRSEASNRFEKGLDPKRCYMAMLRSCHLLEKYANAKIVGGMIEYNNINMEDRIIEITAQKINQVLGVKISEDEIVSIFHRLGFQVEKNESNFIVTVPTRRTDIYIKEDLIEEVGRIYGMDKIKGKPMILPVKPGYINKTKRYIRNKLSSLGLNETLSYALISEQDFYKFIGNSTEIQMVKLLDPMTEDRNTLRASVLPSLMNIYEYNKARGVKDISLYEVGHVFYKSNNCYHEDEHLAILMSGNYIFGLHKEAVDFYIVKGILEELLESLGYKNRYKLVLDANVDELHKGQSARIMINNVQVGIIGKLHPNMGNDDVFVIEIDLDKLLSFRVKAMQYRELSKYPIVQKDMAFIIDNNILAEDIMDTIKKAGGRLLTNVSIFDIYEGDTLGLNKKSIAFNLTFNDDKKTLLEEEVMTIFDKIISEVQIKHNAILRDK